MRLSVVWLPEAKAEFDEARHRYKAMDPALGQRFGAAIKAAVHAMQGNPQGYQRLENELRRDTWT